MVLRIDRTVRAQRRILRDFHLQHARGTGRGDGKRRQLVYGVPCRRRAPQGAIRDPKLTRRHFAAAVPTDLRSRVDAATIGIAVGVVRGGCAIRLSGDAYPFVIHCAQVRRIGRRRILGHQRSVTSTCHHAVLSLRGQLSTKLVIVKRVARGRHGGQSNGVSGAWIDDIHHGQRVPGRHRGTYDQVRSQVGRRHTLAHALQAGESGKVGLLGRPVVGVNHGLRIRHVHHSDGNSSQYHQ